MAGMVDAGKNVMLSGFSAVAAYASLHNGDPGTSGVSEISGGSYARKAITWNTPASGNLDSSNQPVFDVPSGNTVMYVGYWSALSGGTFYGSKAVVNESFGADGQYTLDDADISLSES